VGHLAAVGVADHGVEEHVRERHLPAALTISLTTSLTISLTISLTSRLTTDQRGVCVRERGTSPHSVMPIITMRATQKKRMSDPVSRSVLGKKACYRVWVQGTRKVDVMLPGKGNSQERGGACSLPEVGHLP